MRTQCGVDLVGNRDEGVKISLGRRDQAVGPAPPWLLMPASQPFPR